MLQILMTASILMVRDIESPPIPDQSQGLLLLYLKTRNKIIYNAPPPKNKQKTIDTPKNKTPPYPC